MFDYFENKNILITGGNGYLASNVIHLLQDVHCTIRRFGRKGTNWQNFKNTGKTRVHNIEGDIKDQNVWDSLLEEAEIVLHFAAQTSVYVANSNPLEDLQVNVLPMLNMLEACRRKSRRFIILYSGAHTEAGVPEKLPVNENHPDRPVTVYDVHKLTSENYLKHYVREGVVRGGILRLANVYGPGPESSSADRGVLNQMIRKALNHETLTVHGEGNFIRDYLYVKDAAKAFLDAAMNIDKLNGRHFVIGSGQGITVAQAFHLVAERVEKKTGHKSVITHIDPPNHLSPIEYRNFVADSRLFSSLTDWKAQTDLVDGIDFTIDSYLQVR